MPAYPNTVAIFNSSVHQRGKQHTPEHRDGGNSRERPPLKNEAEGVRSKLDGTRVVESACKNFCMKLHTVVCR